MKNVLVPLADGFEDVEALASVDVLRRGGVSVVTASLRSDGEARSAHGVCVRADAVLSAVLENDYAAILLPGGGKGTQNLLADEKLLRRLARQKASGGLVCAICAAPMVLHAAGVLDGAFTCYPGCDAPIGRAASGAAVEETDGVITGRGPGTVFAFALAVLARLTDAATARAVADGMLLTL